MYSDILFRDDIREKIRDKLNWTVDFLRQARADEYVLRIFVANPTGLLVEDVIIDIPLKRSDSLTEVEIKVASIDGDMSSAFISGILAQSDRLLADTYGLQSESHVISTKEGPTILLYSIGTEDESDKLCYLAIFTNGKEDVLQKIGTGINFLLFGLKTILYDAIKSSESDQ